MANKLEVLKECLEHIEADALRTSCQRRLNLCMIDQVQLLLKGALFGGNTDPWVEQALMELA